jgi:HK97 family phage prohead protease
MEKMMNASQLETRDLGLFEKINDTELRIAAPETPNRLIGYAAVYGKLSRDLGGFKERIAGPQAFRTSLTNGTSIRALVDHDGSRLLASTANGTLRMIGDDPIGLRVEIDLPDTSYARDILELVKRGESRSMSFGFRVRGVEGQRFVKEAGMTVRELHDIDLKEVSVLALVAAYPDTSIAVRSLPTDGDKNSSPQNGSFWQTYRSALVKG